MTTAAATLLPLHDALVGPAARYDAPPLEGDRVETADEQRLLDAALRGGQAEVVALLRHLTPVIQARVGRALLADPYGAARRNLREEVEDIAQDVFATLFEHDARVLRAWSPERGLSLRNFVGMVARRRTGAILSVRKRNPWYEEPMEADDLERGLPQVAEAEADLAARQAFEEAVRRTAAEQTDRGRRLLRLMFLEGQDDDEVQASTGMSRDAVYQWRSRLRKVLRAHLDDVLGTSDARGGAR